MCQEINSIDYAGRLDDIVRFPLDVTCPECGCDDTVDYPRKYRCAGCKALNEVDDEGNVVKMR